jgi:hypothetical protein
LALCRKSVGENRIFWQSFGRVLADFDIAEFWQSYGRVLAEFWQILILQSFGRFWQILISDFGILYRLRDVCKKIFAARRAAGLLAEFWQSFGRVLAEFWQSFGRVLAEFWQIFDKGFWDF